MLPVFISSGVTGSPSNLRLVGTVGENFTRCRLCVTGIAILVAAVGEDWKTRWLGSLSRQCQKQ